ncbi:Holliday junction resolvase RuvX, partial [bacterium]
MEEMKRVLGIDPGTKRVGFAVSDALGVTAQGMETFVRRDGGMDELIAYIGKLIEEYGIGTVVIGLPLSMSGNEIEGSRRARDLASAIERRLGVEVVLRDERMTSLEAERLMRSNGSVKRPQDIDRLSAVLILQG